MIKETSPSSWGHEADATGVVNLDMHFDPGTGSETAFFRADLIFTGVDHSGVSYEVRVYLNNPHATASTPRTSEEGYAGCFVVFGHGNCFGEAGHCEVGAPIPEQAGSVRRHPMTPKTRTLTITAALRRVLDHGGGSLKTVTLVPVSKNPRQEDRRPTADLFKYEGVSLQTYQ